MIWNGLTLPDKPHYQDEWVVQYFGDCCKVLLELEGTFSAIVTDPPWPGTEKTCNPSRDYDIVPIFNEAALSFRKLSDRLIVILGCDTDPRFLLTVPKDYPYLLTCWLRRIPPTYKGNILYGADIAYTFGTPRAHEHASKNRSKTHILLSETYSVSAKHRDGINTHPCFRPLKTMKWLLTNFTREGDIILDPFCGSGTTLLAAKETGRKAVGIELEESNCQIGVRRLRQSVMPLETTGPEIYQFNMGEGK